MNKFKVGDKVTVVSHDSSHTCWIYYMDEFLGQTSVIVSIDSDDDIRLEDSYFVFPPESLKLVSEDSAAEEFDIEKVDISWFTDRVLVGEQVARDDKISLLLRDVNRGSKIELTQIRDTSFVCGTHWKYVVAERHFDLFVKWIALQEDIFNQRHLRLTLKRRNEEMQDAKDELDKQSEESEWYNNIPDKGLMCWVSDIDAVPDSSCLPSVVVSCNKDTSYPYKTNGEHFTYATPLTLEEAEEFFMS